MSPPHRRLGLVVLLLLALPGLLLSGAESLRVCLHGWVGVDDACVAISAQGPPSCCAQAPEGPRALGGSACDGCCVELTCPATERSAPAPVRHLQPGLGPALLPRVAVDVVAAVSARPPAGIPLGSPDALPGRAPIPLRI